MSFGKPRLASRPALEDIMLNLVWPKVSYLQSDGGYIFGVFTKLWCEVEWQSWGVLVFRWGRRSSRALARSTLRWSFLDLVVFLTITIIIVIICSCTSLSWALSRPGWRGSLFCRLLLTGLIKIILHHNDADDQACRIVFGEWEPINCAWKYAWIATFHQNATKRLNCDISPKLTTTGVICNTTMLIGSFQCNLTRPLQENQAVLGKDSLPP